MAQGPSGSGNTPGFSSPVQIPGSNWKTCCSAGNYFTVSGCFATKTDGTAWAWGSTAYGQLGLNQGGTPGPNSPHISSPTQIPGTNWDRIEMNGSETLAIGRKTDGTMWVWGYNATGRMGIPSLAINASRSSPIQIPGTTWSDKFSNYGHMVYAIKTDGTLWCWGQNNTGNLGQNDRTQRSSPTQIPGTTWANVVSFNTGAVAKKTDNTLWAWGQNSGGMLGQNQSEPGMGGTSSPVQIPGTDWARVMGNGSIFATKKVY
jgi:alpha-tubulin suppressor-like RCC1 family protein